MHGLDLKPGSRSLKKKLHTTNLVNRGALPVDLALSTGSYPVATHTPTLDLELLGDSLRKANRIVDAVAAFRSMVTITLEMSGGPQRSEWISHAVHATGVLGRALADVDRKIDALEEMDGGRALVEELSRSDVSDAKDLDIAASWWECHADCLESIGDDVYASRARRKAKALRARSAAIE